MGLNDPKQAQKTLNIFKMILNELKMGLNELKVLRTDYWNSHQR